MLQLVTRWDSQCISILEMRIKNQLLSQLTPLRALWTAPRPALKIEVNCSWTLVLLHYSLKG